MNRNGVVQAYEDPDGLDARRMSWNTIGIDPNSSMTRVGGDLWDCEVCHSGPMTPNLLQFQNVIYPFVGNAPLLLAVSGQPSDSYEFEVFQHHELIGTLVPGKTPSHAEPALFGKIVEVVKNSTASKPLTPKELPSLWERFKYAVSESLPTVIQGAVGVGRLLAGDIVGGSSSLMGTASRMLPPPTIFNTSDMSRRQARSQPLMLGM